MFHETDDACADCGGDAFAATDTVGSGDELVPLCFSCYVGLLDRVRACGVVSVADEDEFVVGAQSVEEARDLAQSVADELSPAVEASVESVATLADMRDLLGDYHVRELARAARSETRHVYAGTSERGTVLDVETRTDEEARDKIRDSLARHVLDETRLDVRKRDDVSDALADTFTTLVEHGAARRLGVGRAVWKLAKERGVSRDSERAARNQRAGREFEEFFSDWCDERGIELVRGKTGIVRRYPETADEIARKTDGLAGVPDFLVHGDGQRVFGSEWRPDGDVFVEVKRGESTLSREQQEVVAHLKSYGFDVYILRGEPDYHRFERR
ncbi:MAG: hypothetical protein U5J64_04005 [Halobacteriales archaeon]|nr:hypothetical protein [Halobacteriales archaeon]